MCRMNRKEAATDPENGSVERAEPLLSPPLLVFFFFLCREAETGTRRHWLAGRAFVVHRPGSGSRLVAPLDARQWRGPRAPKRAVTRAAERPAQPL